MPLRATWILRQIGHLYQIEKQLRQAGAGPKLRAAQRASQAAPILARLHRVLNAWKTSGAHLPASSMGQAIDYALGQWDLLGRYLHDGRLEIDNNQVENAIRPTAVGKKFHTRSPFVPLSGGVRGPPNPTGQGDKGTSGMKFLAHGGGTDGVFDLVVVDFQTAVVEVAAEKVPLTQGVVDGLSHGAGRQVGAGGFPRVEHAVEPRKDGSGLAGTLGGAQLGAGAGLA